MIYVYSAAAGLLYGAAMGGLKYIALWRRILIADENKPISAKEIYIRMPIDYGINVLTFVILFLVRNMILPLSFTAAAIAAAIGLSVIGRFFSVRKVFEKVSPQSETANAESKAGTEEIDND